MKSRSMLTRHFCRVLCRLAAKLKNIYCFNLSDFVWFCDFLLSDVVFRLRDKIICYTFGMFSAIDKLCGACGCLVAGKRWRWRGTALGWDTWGHIHLARLSRNE